jgi:hypothetical protein
LDATGRRPPSRCAVGLEPSTDQPPPPRTGRRAGSAAYQVSVVLVPPASGTTIQAPFPPRTSRCSASSPFLVWERSSRNRERRVVPRSVAYRGDAAFELGGASAGAAGLSSPRPRLDGISSTDWVDGISFTVHPRVPVSRSVLKRRPRLSKGDPVQGDVDWTECFWLRLVHPFYPAFALKTHKLNKELQPPPAALRNAATFARTNGKAARSLLLLR